MKRILFLTAAVLATLLGTASVRASSPAVRLVTIPTKIYFTTSNAKEALDGSIFFLVVETTGAAEIQPLALDLTFRRGSTILKRERFSPQALEKIDVRGIPPTRLYPASEAAQRRWPHAFRLALALPAEIGADNIDVRLSWTAGSATAVASESLAFQTYDQKTPLIFPFRGNGIISAAGALFGGHRNRSGLYAIDALGLNPTYGPMISSADDDSPSNYAGWGREVIAPAAGTIAFARNDHVDQPKAGTSDPAHFDPKWPDGGDPGNNVIIDHGNGEFSMIAHLQKGSVRVKAGDRVAQGQVIGLMGNSGDTSGPHVHYQLQDGPDWERSDALPFKFTNVQSLKPGSYFNAG